MELVFACVYKVLKCLYFIVTKSIDPKARALYRRQKQSILLGDIKGGNDQTGEIPMCWVRRPMPLSSAHQTLTEPPLGVKGNTSLLSSRNPGCIMCGVTSLNVCPRSIHDGTLCACCHKGERTQKVKQ